MWLGSYQITPRRTAHPHTYWPSSSTAVTTAARHTEQKEAFPFSRVQLGGSNVLRAVQSPPVLVIDTRVTSALPRLYTSARQNQAIIRVYDTPFRGTGCSNTGPPLSAGRFSFGTWVRASAFTTPPPGRHFALLVPLPAVTASSQDPALSPQSVQTAVTLDRRSGDAVKGRGWLWGPPGKTQRLFPDSRTCQQQEGWSHRARH